MNQAHQTSSSYGRSDAPTDPDLVGVKDRENTAPGVHEVAASVVFIGAFLTIAGAWFFELVLGLQPCALCLTQRTPYYIGVVLAGITAFLAWSRMQAAETPQQEVWLRTRPFLVRVGLGALALLFLGSAGLGVYHAGVEWQLWQGPTGCTGMDTTPGSVGDLLSALDTVRVVPCDEAPWVFLGLSLAGWNALISLGLAGVAAIGALAKPDRVMPRTPFYY
ncbi:MAG: disulfide bond formation protein B [Pseudomonadota bacterium]